MQTQSKNVAGRELPQTSKPSATPFLPAKHTITAIREALPSCKGCDLYRCATQVVPGIGRSTASLMLVGEAPGPQEDLQGRPFVGPAGKLLHQALEELRLNPKEIYITNAVKHFKFLQQGSKRLNKNPLLSEVSACRPWLLAEIDAINPHIILCLGTSASKSLLGSSFALMRNRGKVLSSPYADRVMATIHPSAILHARDRTSRKELYQYLRDDLELAYRLSRQHNR